MPLTIIPREDWNARLYNDISYLRLPVTNIFIAQTNTAECETVDQGKAAMVALQKVHFFKKLTDIRYNFTVDNKGNIYEGRGWVAQPSILRRLKSYEPFSFFITFLRRSKDIDPPDMMYEALDQLIVMGIKLNFISKRLLIHHLRPF